MRLPHHKWPDTNLGQGALFFFQNTREMLAADTHESYRAMTLDTLARLDEALGLVEQVQTQRIPPPALDPVYAEMKWSLNRDPVAKTLAGPEIEAILEGFAQKKLSPSDQHRHLRYLHGRLQGQYKLSLERKILETFPLPDERLALRQLTGFYCSHIINLGYSRQYILRIIDDDFFAGPVQRVRPQLLQRFFDYFDGKRRPMSVVTAVAPNCADLLVKLNGQIARGPAALLSPAARTHFAAKPGQDFTTVSVRAFDEEGAVREAEHRLASLRAIAFINPQPCTFEWQAEHYVIRSKAATGLAISAPANTIGLAPVELRPGGASIKAVKSYSKLLTSSFDGASTERLLNSINTCALARKSGDRELQLISIWSAIEVLLSEPDPGAVRIVHYVHHIAPCVCLRYIRRQLVAVYERLLVLYKRPFFNLVKREGHYDGDDIHRRFATLLLLPQNKPLRDDLLTLLENNPLARNRVSKLHLDYGNPKKLYSAVEAHFTRVSWQLHRIYRARNDLVHAGRVPSFLDALIWNAFEYYAATIRAIGAYGKRNAPDANIDQAVTDIGVDHIVQMRFASSLKKESSFTAEQIAMLAAP